MQEKPDLCKCANPAAGQEIRHFSRTARKNAMGTESCLGIQFPGEDPLNILRHFPEERGAVAAQFAFGGWEPYPQQPRAGLPHWPLMWLQGDECSGKNMTGMQAWTAGVGKIEYLELEGQIVGTAWSDADAEYCMLAGLLPEDVSRPRKEQARAVFERMEKVLGSCGMSFLDLVRTWFYLDRILDWYDLFNAVRTQFFTERQVFSGRVPASTGIGARNPSGAALVAGALAVRPKHPGTTAVAIPSPLQCPALDYKSSFSRAIELTFPDRRQLLISGTASIATRGASVHCGNVAAQIGFTMEVVHAILHSRGMSWCDATRGIAYFRDMESASLLGDWCRKHRIPELPVINMHATICRDDLLFELELDAVSTPSR